MLSLSRHVSRQYRRAQDCPKNVRISFLLVIFQCVLQAWVISGFPLSIVQKIFIFAYDFSMGMQIGSFLVARHSERMFRIFFPTIPGRLPFFFINGKKDIRVLSAGKHEERLQSFIN